MTKLIELKNNEITKRNKLDKMNFINDKKFQIM